jgi:DNA-binding MarR family transcriptional regulator/N-acetylglutamate synthase-like GNAT family acetyltransferase
MHMEETEPLANAVRRFNRFYTRQIGALDDAHLNSAFSLTEARVLYELAHRAPTTAREIGAELGLDAGYLSRILRSFEERGLIVRRQCEKDGRRNNLHLTDTGKGAFAGLNDRAQTHIEGMLDALPERERARLVEMMRGIEEILDEGRTGDVPYLLRPARPGDLGWVVHRHGVLYAKEYGWDERFEALVAGVVAEFVRNFDPARERCWIAERNGRIVGSVLLVKGSEDVAKLRLLLVEPEARGLGIGKRLVEECIAFAQEAGYRKITLWTNDVLHAARSIYQRAGFRMVHEEPHARFGSGLVGETWELAL